MDQDKKTISISLPCMDDAELEAVREPIESGWVTQGPKVLEFEKRFAEVHGVNHAVATTSCTTALHLALVAMGIGPGDEVIVPAFTWVSTANVVLYCGAEPVFADVERETFNIDPASVKNRLTDRTKAVIPVHLFGRCADVVKLREILPEKVWILEDAACAAGASTSEGFAGSLGDAGAFSFHPRKSITTGEGGMVTTQSDSLAEVMRKLRNHGASVPEEQRHRGPRPYLLPSFNLLGFNYRMTDIQGAIGIVQLEKLTRFRKERAGWARWYREELAELEWLSVPTEPEGGLHGWQAFVTYLDPDTSPMPRNELMERLQEKGVSTRPGTHAVHMLEYYQERFEMAPDDYPNARKCHENSMAIPLHNRMGEEDYIAVANAIKAIK